MKKLIIFATTNKNFISINLIKTIINSKLFKIEAIILKKKTPKKEIYFFKKKLNYKTKIYLTDSPEKNKMLCSQISKNEINLCICVGFEFLIKRNFLNLFAEGILNIHPSPLPLNRGCHHTFWAIYKKTNHGCTLHYMNEQLDEGRIVDKIQFNIKESDTAEIIHEKNKLFMIKILKRNLKNIYKNKIFSNKQKKVHIIQKKN